MQEDTMSGVKEIRKLCFCSEDYKNRKWPVKKPISPTWLRSTMLRGHEGAWQGYGEVKTAVPIECKTWKFSATDNPNAGKLQ